LALKKLDDKKNGRARELAKSLEAIGYHDPSFAGGTEFVLGVVAFREAEAMEESSREHRYVVAANYLREAEHRALVDQRRKEWSYALGVSLYRMGSAIEARPFLEEAVRPVVSGRGEVMLAAAEHMEAAILLAETYLYLKEPERLKEALILNTGVV